MEVLLFYSNNCDICKSLMDSKLYNKLDKICIDNIEIRKRLPSYVKQVPLIIIKHHGNQQILMGNQLNEWFNMASNSNINTKTHY